MESAREEGGAVESAREEGGAVESAREEGGDCDLCSGLSAAAGKFWNILVSLALAFLALPPPQLSRSLVTVLSVMVFSSRGRVDRRVMEEAGNSLAPS